MSANDQTERFGQLVNTKAELFASSSSTTKQHDERQRMQEEALGVVRSLTNAHLASEKETLPLFSAMLEHVNGSRPVTRSKQKQKQAEEQEKGPGKVEGTPLSEVYVPKGGDVDGIVWEQLEMRLKTVQQVLSSLLGHSQSKPSQESDQDQDSDEAAMDQDAQEEEEEEDSQDDVSEDGAQEMDQDDLEEIDEDESDASSLDEPEQVEPLNGNPEQQPSNKQSRRKGPTSPVDDQFFSLHDFLQQSEQGEAQMARQISEAQKEPQGESDDDDDEDEPEEDVDLFAQVPEEDEEEDVQDLGDAADIGYADFFDPPPSNTRPAPQREAPKASSSSSSSKPTGSSKGVRFSDVVRVKPIRSRKKKQLADAGVGGGLFQRLLSGEPVSQEDVEELERLGVDSKELLQDEDDDDDDMEEDEDDEGEGEEEEEEEDDDDEGEGDGDEEDEENMEEAGDEAYGRLKSDLFDDEDDEAASGSDASEADDQDPSLSRHERRQRALQSQISSLEAENVGKKDWVLSGEARARDRPLNSLLEQDLEFDHTGKAKPTVTTESVASLEERIRQRILDQDFDDVERKLPLDPNTLAPAKLMDVSSEPGGGQTLAQAFEQQYQSAAGQGQDVDEPTRKKHQEISDLFDGICTKLDALSNARYTPKPPQTQIQNTSNVSAVSLEDALPTSHNTSTLLAPEEVYAASSDPTKAANKTELDSAEKKSVRRRNRRSRASTQKQVQELLDKRKGSDKDRARKELVGTKGVTVLGKPSMKKGGKLDKKAQKAQQSG